MGELLKPRVMTKAEAKVRLEKDIAEATSRYQRRCSEIDARKGILSGGFNDLPGRCRFAIKNCLMREGPPNEWGRPTWIDFEGEITPEVVARLSARQLLRQPNAGHTTLNTIAAWLEHHGYELKV